MPVWVREAPSSCWAGAESWMRLMANGLVVVISAALGIPQKRSTAIFRKPMIRHPHSRDSVLVEFRTAVAYQSGLSAALMRGKLDASKKALGMAVAAPLPPDIEV